MKNNKMIFIVGGIIVLAGVGLFIYVKMNKKPKYRPSTMPQNSPKTGIGSLTEGIENLTQKYNENEANANKLYNDAKSNPITAKIFNK